MSLKKSIGCFVSVMLLGACGESNMFESLADKPKVSSSGKSGAVASILNQDWAAAQAQLEAVLKANPNDQEARSMLGNVFMKKSGIDTLSVSNDVTESSDEKGTVHVPSMIKALPPATTENLENLQKSVDTLKSIPQDQRTAGQSLQLAMAEFSYSMILTKKAAADDAGSYDAGKAAKMTTAEADNIIGLMDTSAATVGSIGGEQNDKGSGKISKTTAEIMAQEGATSADKLRAYLATESTKQKK